MEDFFDTPPEGAIGSATSRPNPVTYKSGKTPAAFYKMADAEKLLESQSLGFYMYDREEKKSVLLKEFSFVALAFYAGVEGFNGVDRWWSTRSADLRKEPIRLFSSLPGAPLAEGLYFGKASSLDGIAKIGETPLPSGCSFSIYCVAHCLQTKTLIDLRFSAMLQSGIKAAIIEAESAAGRTIKDVNLLSLIKGDTLWGFRLTGYKKVDKKGQPYSGKDDLYFLPEFKCGVVPPDSAIGEKCLGMMRQERERHKKFIEENFQQNAAAVSNENGSIPTEQKPFKVPAKDSDKGFARNTIDECFDRMAKMANDDLPF